MLLDKLSSHGIRHSITAQAVSLKIGTEVSALAKDTALSKFIASMVFRVHSEPRDLGVSGWSGLHRIRQLNADSGSQNLSKEELPRA